MVDQIRVERLVEQLLRPVVFDRPEKRRFLVSIMSGLVSNKSHPDGATPLESIASILYHRADWAARCGDGQGKRTGANRRNGRARA